MGVASTAFEDRQGRDEQYNRAIHFLTKKAKEIGPEMFNEEIEDLVFSTLSEANGNWLNFNLLETVIARKVAQLRSQRGRVEHIENDDCPKYVTSNDTTYQKALDHLFQFDVDEKILQLSEVDQLIVVSQLEGGTDKDIQHILIGAGQRVSLETARQRRMKAMMRLRELLNSWETL